MDTPPSHTGLYKVDDTVVARKAYSRHDDGVLPNEIDSHVSPNLLEHLEWLLYDKGSSHP